MGKRPQCLWICLRFGVTVVVSGYGVERRVSSFRPLLERKLILTRYVIDTLLYDIDTLLTYTRPAQAMYATTSQSMSSLQRIFFLIFGRP